MSASVLADQGVKLVQANKYAEGIEKLTQALKSHAAPAWLLERSKAYMRTKEFDLALHDAQKALSVAYSRANRDQMVQAQLRRAITLFRMGQYANADVCAFWAIQLCDAAKASEDDGQQNKVDDKGDYTTTLKEVNEAQAEANKTKKQDGLAAAMGSGRSKDDALRNQALSWRLQALTAMEKVEAGAPGRKVTVVKYPILSDAPKETIDAKPAAEIEEDNSEQEKLANKPDVPMAIAPTWDGIWKQFRAVHMKNDIRTDFYQTDSSLNISFFVKNVPKDDLKVDSKEQSVCNAKLPPIS
jgi:suppressor of G2 allele of SKP1